MPEHCDDRDVSMELISFEDTLWAQRLSYPGPYANAETWITGGRFGGAMIGDDNCKANFPWNWQNDNGEGFLAPDIVAPYIYVVNPYLDSTMTAVASCP